MPAFLIWLAGGMTVSMALGAVSWVVLERPAMRLAARLTSRREPRVAPHAIMVTTRPVLEAA